VEEWSAAAQQGPVTPPFDEAEQARRLRLTWFVVCGLLALLGGGLAYRQLLRADDFHARDRRQSIRWFADAAPRGIIYDRKHRVLAGNRVVTSLAVDLGDLRAEFRDEQRNLARQAETQASRIPAQARLAVLQHLVNRTNSLTGRRESVDAARLERAYTRERTAPFVIAADLSPNELDRLGSVSDLAPLRLVREPRRTYPHGSVAAHALGRVHRESLTAPANPGRPIRYEDQVGVTGLEKQFDRQLRGTPAVTETRVDAWGFRAGETRPIATAQPGVDVVTSLDLDVQQAAEKALAQAAASRGAAVAVSVATGEVLALASKPTFDLAAVSPDLSAAEKRQVDTEGGWFDRSVQGLYAPGSSFKFVTIAAALRTGRLHPNDRLRCDGVIAVGGRNFACHNPAGHGELSLREALAHSCNGYAIRAGLAAGPDALAAEARRLHLHEPTGIELPAETRAMLVPDPAWKRASGAGDWTPGDTANFAIGQGYLRFSPLQAACAFAALARRESLTVPTLLYQPGRPPTGDRPKETLGLADTDYAALVGALRAVVETGIGRNAQVPGVTIAGKSGTAQVDRPAGRTNVAWFVAFAPVENPQIAVAVALEGDQPGVEFAGAEHAAPVVREIIAAYLDATPAR
jgi:penicillin-binding protein 2